MKIVCHREGLSTAFAVTAAVVPARTPKPILGTVKLEAQGDIAVLSATDLELGIHYLVSGVKVEQPGSVVLPAARFSSILRELNDETLTLESADNGVRIRGGSSRFELPAEDPAQFPHVPGRGDEPGHKIKTSVLSGLIRRTVFAVASENSRYALHSVLIEFGDEQVRFVATDGKRLAYMSGPVTVDGPLPESGSLLHPKALALIQKTLSDPDEEITVRIGENDAVFRSGKVTLYSRLVEGRFPRYQDVFPPPPTMKIPLSINPFSSALRQARIVTSDESRGVKFKFSAGELVMESRAADVGQSEVKLPIGYDGDSLEITFDPQLFIDALRVLEPEGEVSLELIDSKRAAVLRTTDGYVYVLMPLTRDV